MVSKEVALLVLSEILRKDMEVAVVTKGLEAKMVEILMERR
jgi:hypothetical protein